MNPEDDLADRSRRLAGGIALAFGAMLHLVMGWITVSTGLVAPAWAVTVLLGAWLALAVGAWRYRRQPLVVLATPFVQVVVVYGVVSLGDAVLGWGA